MLNFGTVYLGVCRPGTLSTLIPSTLDSAHVWFRLTGSQSTWVFAFLILSTRKSVHMTNFKLRIVSTASSFQSRLCSLFLFRLFESLSTWESGNMTFCHIVSTIGSVKYGLYSLLVLSTWESVHLVFTASSVQSGLCSLLVLSTRESVHVGVCLLGICPLGSLATYYSAHIALYQLSVRSIVDSADVQSCLLGSQSNRVSVYLQCIYF